MTLTSRLASSQADLLKMRHFVAKVQSQLGATPAHWHVGDVSWWWGFQNHFHHSNYFQLWEDTLLFTNRLAFMSPIVGNGLLGSSI